jgi:hypothetical protein
MMDRIDRQELKMARNAGNDFSFWEFLCDKKAGPEMAIAYSTVFWPEFVEVDGFVLIKENYDA